MSEFLNCPNCGGWLLGCDDCLRVKAEIYELKKIAEEKRKSFLQWKFGGVSTKKSNQTLNHWER